MLYARRSISSTILGLLLLVAGLRTATAQSDPGDFLGIFVLAQNGGLDSAYGVVFGPDGHLYVCSLTSDEVLRYDGTTGAFIDAYVPDGSGWLDAPQFLVFGPDGLYVSSFNTDEVLRYVRLFLTRYVATTGTNAGNDCTEESDPCATIAHAVAQANGGDILDIAAGTYIEPGLVIEKNLIIQGQGVIVQ